MVSLTRCPAVSFPKVGLYPSRPICQGQQATPSVLFISKSQPGLHLQRVLNTVGRRPEVCLPSNPADPPGLAQDTQRQSNRDPACPILATSALVYNAPQTISRHSSSPTPVSGLDHSVPQPPSPPETTVPASHGLDVPWLNLIERQCS